MDAQQAKPPAAGLAETAPGQKLRWPLRRKLAAAAGPAGCSLQPVNHNKKAALVLALHLRKGESLGGHSHRHTQEGPSPHRQRRQHQACAGAAAGARAGFSRGHGVQGSGAKIAQLICQQAVIYTAAAQPCCPGSPRPSGSWDVKAPQAAAGSAREPAIQAQCVSAPPTKPCGQPPTCDGRHKDGEQRPGLHGDPQRWGHQKAQRQPQANRQQQRQGLDSLRAGGRGECAGQGTSLRDNWGDQQLQQMPSWVCVRLCSVNGAVG